MSEGWEKKQHIIAQFIGQAGYVPSIEYPESYNEKIQWLKLYYHDPLMTTCSDKYAVRKYVANLVGSNYLIPLIGVYDDVDEIDFDRLPEQFVLKLNSGSGQVLICKDKRAINVQDMRTTLKNWLDPRSNLYHYSYEWSYKNIQSKIVCEQYIEQGDGALLDYKFFCFDGVVKSIMINVDRHTKHTICFYDSNWKKQDFTRSYPLFEGDVPKPDNLDEMLRVASRLAGNFPHVRVDLYSIDGLKVYFGELTFYPGNGMERFEPSGYDYIFGKHLKLPGRKIVEVQEVISVERPPNGMYIVLFSHTSNLDGAGRSLLDLVRGLMAQGAVCTVIVPQAGPLQERLVRQGCGVHVAPAEMAQAWWWAFPSNYSEIEPDFTAALESLAISLLPEIRTLRPDFVISQTLVSPWGCVCAEMLAVPHALSVREYGDLDHNLQFPFGFRDSLDSFYRSSDIIFSVTHDVGRHLFGDDSDNKVEVVYSDIELDHVLDELHPVGVLAESFVDRSGPIVCLAGSFQPSKGQEELARAIIYLRESGVAVRCLFVGGVNDVAYFENLKEMVEASAFSGSFLFFEYTPDIHPIFKQVDILVSCARREAFGRTLVEASLLAKPIIYANTGGSREVFRDGVHGLGYEPGNYLQLAEAILSSISNPQDAAARAHAAREFCLGRFNSDKYAGSFYRRIRSAIEGGGRISALAPVLGYIKSGVLKQNARLEGLRAQLRRKDIDWSARLKHVARDYEAEFARVSAERDAMLVAKDLAWENRVSQVESDYQHEIARIGLERDVMLADKDLAWENRVSQVESDYRREINRIGLERDVMLADKDLAWGNRVSQVESDYQREIARIGLERDRMLNRVSLALPMVSLVIVNYNGLRFLPGLLRSLFDLDYPKFEVILVDNASADASLAYVKDNYPQVRVVRSEENLGFAGGNNLGMRHARGELIGLVNNDAEVESSWLYELVIELMRDQAVWVVGSKIVFFRRYVEVRIRSTTFCPARVGSSPDSRELGLLLDESSAFAGCDYRKPVFVSGFYGSELNDGVAVRWTAGDACLFLPVMPGEEDAELVLRMTGAAGGKFDVQIGGVQVASGYLRKGFEEVRVPVTRDLIDAHSFQLINNAGTRLDERGDAGDRGIYEPDKGQFDCVEDMPALCGASMLFKRRALERVGLFDSDFFMYYEDTDLCWRISKLGGVLRYVPASVIRHIHTGSSVEWSPHFLFHVARNHVLLRVKHASMRTAVRGYLVELYRCVRSGWSWLRHDRGRLEGQGFREFRLRLKIQRSLLALMPAALLKRYGWRTTASDML